MNTQRHKSDNFRHSVEYSLEKGVLKIYPAHKTVNNWLFEDSSKDEFYNEKEANLANAMALVAEANGMSVNDLSHLFPSVLRMLKSNSNWSK